MFQDDQPIQNNQPVQDDQPVESPAQPEQPKQPEQPAKPAAVLVKTVQEEKMWAAIGYVAFLGVVTLAMQPKSEFCRKHASQGLVIFVVWFISLLLTAAVPIVGLVFLLATGLAVLGIMKAIQSYEFNFPILSDIAKKVPVNSIIGSLTGKTTEAPAAKEPEQQAEQQSSEPAESTPEVAPEQPAEQQSSEPAGTTPPSQDEEPPKADPQN